MIPSLLKEPAKPAADRDELFVKLVQRMKRWKGLDVSQSVTLTCSEQHLTCAHNYLHEKGGGLPPTGGKPPVRDWCF